jgi:hypothetical protein
VGIDYGMGTTNIDTDTGFRFGVINQSKVSTWAVDDVLQEGESVSLKEFRQMVRDELIEAIEEVAGKHSVDLYHVDGTVEDLLETGDLNFESEDSSVTYEADGYVIETGSDGDWFVVKSDYYTLGDFCSPCAPGAVFLGSSGDVKAYCLGLEFFDEYCACPYDIYSVATGDLVYKHN